MSYKINIDKLGKMSIDCDTIDEVQEVLSLNNGNSTKNSRKRSRAKRNPKEISPGLQTETWNYLCEHDSEEGVSDEDLADNIVSLGFKASSLSPTMSALRGNGYAKKLPNGNHRAVVP